MHIVEKQQLYYIIISMDNIHLHSNQSQKGILKEDINKEKDLEYRKSLPYDAMGDFSGIVSSFLPSKIFGEDEPVLPEIPRSEMLHPEIHKLLTNRDIEEMLEPVDHVSWSCTAEKNYYWTFGG